MHINTFINSSKYLPPPIRSTAKRKHRYKYYIINTVCTTLSTRFSKTFAVFSEGYNTPLTFDNSYSHYIYGSLLYLDLPEHVLLDDTSHKPTFFMATNQKKHATVFLVQLTQVTPRILWQPKIHYLVVTSPTLVSILSLMNPLQATPSYFFTTQM
jgi:hypothetical protein